MALMPDLAIEILSEGTAGNDRGRKLRLLTIEIHAWRDGRFVF